MNAYYVQIFTLLNAFISSMQLISTERGTYAKKYTTKIMIFVIAIILIKKLY